MFDRYQKENSEKMRIFHIALDIMEKVGYEALSIRSICNEAGISTGKFYTYFSSKQALLNHFYEEAEEALSAEGTSKFDGLPLKTQFLEFYRWYMNYIQSFGVEFVINFFNPTNELMDIFTNSNYIMSMMDSFIEKAIVDGYVLPEGKTIRQISREICMITKGFIFSWAASHGAFSLPDVTVDILSRTLDGLLPTPPQK